MSRYTLGIDFGSASARALIVNVQTGEEIADAVSGYAGGTDGVFLDPRRPLLARQRPSDYVDALIRCVTTAVRAAQTARDVSADQIIGIGVDTTGSTPIPVQRNGDPVCRLPGLESNLDAYAWMWKDHTAHAEAARITELAKRLRPQYLAKCGGVYSSEWFWAKILHCLNTAPDVFDAADSWVEFCDFIPAVLAGKDRKSVV